MRIDQLLIAKGAAQVNGDAFSVSEYVSYYTLKEVPQPQLFLALGLLNTNPLPLRPSEKSARDFGVWLTSLRHVNKNSDSKISIRPIAGALGAEILGADLADVSGPEVEAIREAFHQYHVLVFREQELSPVQQK